VILEPANDAQCLGQLTRMAREIVPTTLIRTVAARLGSPHAVVTWLQSLPQSDDNGGEMYRYISCDVAQRVRLLPDDPNCFERAFAALVLLDVLDPGTPRKLVTIDRPLRHTGLVERHQGRWQAIDLFPRRNFDWGNFGKDLLGGVHDFVGKPLLTMYLGDKGTKLADQIGDAQKQLIDKAEKGNKTSEKKEERPAAKSAQPAATSQAFALKRPLAAQANVNREGGEPDGQEARKSALEETWPATAGRGDGAGQEETEERLGLGWPPR
jgi:hypothetical protein